MELTIEDVIRLEDEGEARIPRHLRQHDPITWGSPIVNILDGRHGVVMERKGRIPLDAKSSLVFWISGPREVSLTPNWHLAHLLTVDELDLDERAI